MNHLSEMFKSRKEELGLSLTAITVRSGIPSSKLSDIFNGHRGCNVSTAMKIAKALEIDVLPVK